MAQSPQGPRKQAMFYLPVSRTRRLSVKPGWPAMGSFFLLLLGAILLARDFLMPVTMAFLLFFLLTSGDLLYLKIEQSFDTLKEKRAAYQALREIEESLGNYLGTISLINLGLGVAIGLAFWALEMPAPFLFGVLACLFNFIPYIGAFMAAGLSVAVALVTMDGFLWPAVVGLTYVAINLVEGQLVTPYFLSRRLELNTVVVFIAVALWAWLWSIAGMIVAVPILVMVRVLCEHIPGLEKVANFLSGEVTPGVPAVDEEPGPAAPPPAT